MIKRQLINSCVRVNSEAEAKEAFRLYEERGFTQAGYKLDTPCWIISTGELVARYRNDSNVDSYREITLSQLRNVFPLSKEEHTVKTIKELADLVTPENAEVLAVDIANWVLYVAAYMSELKKTGKELRGGELTDRFTWIDDGKNEIHPPRFIEETEQ